MSKSKAETGRNEAECASYASSLSYALRDVVPPITERQT